MEDSHKRLNPSPIRQRGSRSNASLLTQWWVIPVLLIFSLLLFMWDLQLRASSHTLHPPAPAQRSDIRQVEKLLRDTSKLLYDVKVGSVFNANSLNVSESTKRDLDRLNIEYASAESAFAAISRKSVEVQQQLDECTLEKHRMQTEDAPSGKVNPITASTSISPLSHGDKWLVIGINTVARKGGHDYLMRTLKAIAHELPSDKSDLMYGRILVLVANVQGQFHDVYFKAKAFFARETHHKGIHFEFIDRENLPQMKNPTPGQKDTGTPNRPGHRVRKQTRDIVTVMRESLKDGRRASYYLFLEDDMVLCPSGFDAINYMINKASHYHPDWIAIKASYGMNGIFLHQKDVQVFADYLERHQRRRPPDHLIVEWFAGETKEAADHRQSRQNVAFKYNLFDHVGTSSTLRSANQGAFPRCYEALLEPVVFKVEAFNPRQCPQDDIWPCNVKHPRNALVHWPSVLSSRN